MAAHRRGEGWALTLAAVCTLAAAAAAAAAAGGKTYTLEELRVYNGTDPELPILLALNGTVFDVRCSLPPAPLPSPIAASSAPTRSPRARRKWKLAGFHPAEREHGAGRRAQLAIPCPVSPRAP